MTRAVLGRLAGAVLTLWFAVTVTFAIVALVPADPARAVVGPHATAEDLARVRAHHCLDRGLAARYGCFVGRLARGDLGTSLRTQRPVADVLLDRVGPTALLAGAALLLQLAIGVPLGVWAARRRGRWPDAATGAATLALHATPAFVLATVGLYVVAYRWGWFPLGGYGAGGWDRVRHLALPAMTLAAGGIAAYAHLVRHQVGGALDSDHVRTARAKGAPERAVVWRHALRPALGPVIALVGLDAGVLLGGAVVVESAFAWPGLGRELVLAAHDLDLPVILGGTLVATTATVVASLLADSAHALLDPRARRP